MKIPKEADRDTMRQWSKDNPYYQCNACLHPPEMHYRAKVKNLNKDVNWCSYPYCRCKGYSD